MTKIRLTCSNCGETFKRYRSSVSSGKDFCSRKCYLDSEANKVRTPCSNCGETTVKKESRVKDKDHVFCDTSCMSEYMQSHEWFDSQRSQ